MGSKGYFYKKGKASMIKKFDLLILSALLIAMNAWYLHAPYGVSWDNASSFEGFHFFYNHFFFYKELPQWMPYYSFGIPAHYWQIAFLNPINYLAILLGSLFQATDILFVFKVCLLLEQQVFLLGLYLLARKLYVSRATVFLVCLGGIASLFSLNQLPYDFFFYYMFPWVVFCFMRFLETKRPEWFWMSGIMTLAWLMGNTPYFLFIWIPVLLLIGGHLVLQETGWKFLFCLGTRSWGNVLCFALCVLMALVLFFPLIKFAGFMEFLTRGAGGHNSLYTFLTYINSDLFREYCRRFILGEYAASYTGLFLLILFFWGVFKLQGVRYSRAFLWAAFALLWVAFAGIGAALAFFFPGLAYYRHVGYVYGLLKVLVLICAGFGLDLFWKEGLKKKIIILIGGMVGLLFLLDMAELSNPWLLKVLSEGHWKDALKAYMGFDSFFWRYGSLLVGLVALVAIRYFGPGQETSRNRIVKVVLMAIICLDIFSFQYHIYRQARINGAPYPREFVEALGTARPLYRTVRTEVPQDDRGLKVMIALSGGVKYATVHNVAQYSPCSSAERLDLQPFSISRLRTVAGGRKHLPEIMGCSLPKLRLEKDPFFLVEDDGQIIGDIPRPVVISGRVDVRNFNSHVLEAVVEAPSDGAWLVYADTYHPGWHVTVDGVRQPLRKAYGAFKAVFVKGAVHVKFYYQDALTGFLSHVIMWIGIILSGVFVVVYFRTLCRNMFR